MMFFGHAFLILSFWVVLSKLEEVDDAFCKPAEYH
ncbi:unnamed protein product [Acanthoscelides obtectus]|uniref:Uncharacterized protein n=1 Tax=Acanthoscelides obtectus TaxID=200917 RepID=A0A9P0PDQ3_ACAOB|nr:unnamed protein product [Acanthoscelides obtectus]CAK1637719.1 hypothetical protein AOBTE_LOCUS10148 [Acanthoscelides obtectus]